jgi:hypothetical protein
MTGKKDGGKKDGGKKDGGNPPSSGGNRTPSSTAPAQPVPTPGPTPPPSGGGGGGSQSSPARAVNAATTYQATTPSSSQQKEKKQERVATLTTKAKDLISGATSTGIADLDKFKGILGKLKDLGKDTKVQNLQTQKKEAVTAAKTAAQAPGGNPPPGYTQEQLDQAIKDALAKQGDSGGLTQEDLDAALANMQKTGLTKEDLDAAFSSYAAKDTSSDASAMATGPTAAASSEFDDWIKSFSEDKDAGAFDPDLFRNLLGELESSKYRQKQWNERTAKAAYTY